MGFEIERSPGVVFRFKLDRIESDIEGSGGNLVEDVKTWCQG